VVIGIILSGATSALAVPQGFLPSAVGWQPVATLDDFLTTNTLNDPYLPQINLCFGLPLNNEAQLQILLDQLYDPTSTNYEQFLTPDQFTEMFGPTPDQYQTVIDFVQANGLTVTGVYSNRIILDASGTVDQIQNAFGVTMEVYQDPTDLRYFLHRTSNHTSPQRCPFWTSKV
jgi:subtilase family serine protease